MFNTKVCTYFSSLVKTSFCAIIAIRRADNIRPNIPMTAAIPNINAV